jgi:hypothetical protein
MGRYDWGQGDPAWDDKQRLDALNEMQKTSKPSMTTAEGPYKIAALKDSPRVEPPTTVADTSRTFLADRAITVADALPVPARSVDEYNAEVASVLAAVADLMDDRSANNERLLARLKDTIADKAAEKDPRFADFLKEVETQRAWDEERKLLKKMMDGGPYKEYTFGKSTSPNTDKYTSVYADDDSVAPLGSSLSKAMEDLYEEKIRTSLSDYMPRKKKS